MLEASWSNPWFRRIGVAVWYGCGIALFREFAIPHFLLLTGVHLAVLLLTRYRDWPALVVGEVASLIPMSVAYADTWGVAWATLTLTAVATLL